MLYRLCFIIIFSFALIASQDVLAHSKLNKTQPENGEVMQVAPENIYLQFTKKIRLTRVDFIFEQNDPIKLDLDKYRKFGNVFEFANPSSLPGKYRIEYRGIGEDGHVMKNGFSFEVKKK